MTSVPHHRPSTALWTAWLIFATLLGGCELLEGGLGASDADAVAGADAVDGADTDTSRSVCERWRDAQTRMTEGAWSGDAAACVAGDVSAPGVENALHQVNFFRGLAGLPAVRLNDAWQAGAQACALMMHANGRLDHYPDESWSCYTPAGAQSAGDANLSGVPGVVAVRYLMIDPGNETTMGHRRTLLSRGVSAVGLGSTDSWSCLQTYGDDVLYDLPDEPGWTAWPPPGQFPIEETVGEYDGWNLSDTGWSFHANNIALDQAQVSITVDGIEQPISVTTLAPNYGDQEAIRMLPQGWREQAGVTYTVNITNISPPVSYEVEFVSCAP